MAPVYQVQICRLENSRFNGTPKILLPFERSNFLRLESFIRIVPVWEKAPFLSLSLPFSFSPTFSLSLCLSLSHKQNIGTGIWSEEKVFWVGNGTASDAASYNCNNKKSSSSKKQKLAEAAAPPTTPPAPTTAPSAVPTSTTASTTTATAPTATFWTFFTTDSMTVPTRILNLKMIFI